MISALLFALMMPSNVQAYEYPYHDPYLATLSTGLVRSPGTEAFIDSQIYVHLLNGRTSSRPLTYRFYPKSKDNFIVLIPGLGSQISDPMTNFLASEMAAAGHSVMIVPDHFTPTFARTASRTGIVGVTSLDAEDMRNALTQIFEQLKAVQGFNPTHTQLVGYSLGALLAGFVVAQEQNSPTLRFEKTVLINPPIDLLYGMQTLDSFMALKKLLPEPDRINAKLEGAQLLIKAWVGDKLDPNYFLNMTDYFNVSEVGMQFLIGDSFHNQLQHIFDWITIRSRKMHMPTPAISNFEDYMQAVVIEQLSGTYNLPTTTIELTSQQSLPAYYDFFKNSKNIYLIDNQDDILLHPNDVDYIQNWFGSRATIYPYGGHMGNAWYADNQADLIKILQNY